MWKFLHASVAGTSHAVTGTPCQDASRVALISASQDREVLVLTCADGAGSSKFAREASEAACHRLCIVVENHVLTSDPLHFDLEIAKRWIDEIHCHLSNLAAEEQTSKREWACTMLGAVLTPNQSLFFQVGDGAIVTYSETQGCNTVFWPDSGEYANMTTFLTDDNYAEKIQTVLLDDSIEAIALFTDGIQRLALDFKNQSAHPPFFKPMFEALKQVNEGTVLEPDLVRFLNSEAVNERTDDDKTLVLARWC